MHDVSNMARDNSAILLLLLLLLVILHVTMNTFVWLACLCLAIECNTRRVSIDGHADENHEDDENRTVRSRLWSAHHFLG